MGYLASDDHACLAVLRELAQRADPVPPAVIAAARGSYAWRTIDAELAGLELDTADEQHLAGVRSGGYGMRMLVFSTPEWSLELAVTDERIDGQLIPSGPAQVEIRTPAGAVESVVADEFGRFTVIPPPTGMISLHCGKPGGASVVTEWTRL
jgi:hypothetical protein